LIFEVQLSKQYEKLNTMKKSVTLASSKREGSCLVTKMSPNNLLLLAKKRSKFTFEGRISLSLRSLLLGVALAAGVFSLSSCAKRAPTPPRSEVMEDARERGIPVASVEEDNAKFLAFEENQKNRLIELLKERSGQSDRDLTYRIGPQDEIEINVFDVPELNLAAKVNQTGFLSLPLLGGVKAVGLTEPELQATLQEKLKSYLKNPEVAVAVKKYASQKVSVVGAVNKPGAFALEQGGQTIQEVINLAGGINAKASNFLTFVPGSLSAGSSEMANDSDSRARLAVSLASGKQAGFEIPLDQLYGTTGGIPLQIPIRGGDMIVLPEAGKISVEGEVEKPGQYELSQQMTVLGALNAAGSITYSAKIDEVEIVRDISPFERARYVFDLDRIRSGEIQDLKLRTGDVLRVPTDSGKRMTETTFEGLSRIINFGVGGTVNVAQ
jgi:polysaccharide export outer membrane protein